MNHLTRWISAPLAVFVLGLFSVAANAAEQTSQRYIDVTGKGVVQAVPDMGLVELTFSERDKEAQRAKSQVDAQVNKLLELTRKLEIDDRDIQAARLALYPEYDNENRRELIGYRVSREVRVRLRDLLQYPALLEGAVSIGATHTGQLQLDFSARQQLEDQALQAAYQNARQQAQLLAQSAGDPLGDVLNIQAALQHSPAPLRMAMMSEMKGDASYPTGEMAVTRQVQVRFALTQ